MIKNKITVILPVHNGDSTLNQTIQCLYRCRNLFSELIIIDDGSVDQSLEIIKSIKCKKIVHPRAIGLANSYNQAISSAKGEIIVTVHQDVVFKLIDFKKLVKPFLNPYVVATSHQVILPLKIWQQYNFWQKLFFARKVNLLEKGIDGKFDGFRKSSLIKIGLFDSHHFKTAGEDGDVVFRLQKIGKIIQTTATITHLHSQNNHFSLYEIFRKQAQYSQAQGALLRLGHLPPWHLLKTFFREIIIISVLVPYLNLITILLILVYSFAYSWPIFIYHKFEVRHLLVAPINILLLFVSTYFSINGFLKDQQTL